VWTLTNPMLAISSSIVGGGVGPVSWVLNLTVDPDYARLDPVRHLTDVATGLGLTGRGIGLMTAVNVATWSSATIDEATVHATVGVNRPVWAADANRPAARNRTDPGTINVIAAVPVRLSAAALVNAVATITEAKVQALSEHRVAGTGTASDAICVLCPTTGDEEPFGGPRSAWGGRLAQAAFDAVAAGIVRQRA
jgi:adenosylcobinamide amidohydrolase